jgi:hypothetical protein
MNSKTLEQKLKGRFPANVVQFHTAGERVEVRPTLKDEIHLIISENTVALTDTEENELAEFDLASESLVDDIEKRVRKYILS